MKENTEDIQNLETELQVYFSSGIHLLLEGRESCPERIATACAVAENGTYMRDYMQDETGRVNKINFNFVSE